MERLRLVQRVIAGRPPPACTTAVPLLIGQLSLAPAPTCFAPGRHL